MNNRHFQLVTCKECMKGRSVQLLYKMLFQPSHCTECPYMDNHKVNKAEGQMADMKVLEALVSIKALASNDPSTLVQLKYTLVQQTND